MEPALGRPHFENAAGYGGTDAGRKAKRIPRLQNIVVIIAAAVLELPVGVMDACADPLRCEEVEGCALDRANQAERNLPLVGRLQPASEV